jgi:hypothetical protein
MDIERFVVTKLFETKGNPEEPNGRLTTMVYIYLCPNCGMYVLQEAIPILKTKGL